jgi:hypothetical protein
MGSISFNQSDVKKDNEATKKNYDFDNWYRLLNVLCEEMFLNSWESLGNDREDAEARFYNTGDTVKDTCLYIMDKYDLDDCRTLNGRQSLPL